MISNQPAPLSSVRIEEQGFDSKVRRNALIFAIMMVCLQIFVIFIFSFRFFLPNSTINIAGAFVAIMHGLLVVAGFGLIFSYNKKLLWSGIGFSFLIMALCLEYWPLLNAFWIKTAIQTQNAATNRFSDYAYDIVLTNNEATNFFSNCITMAMKCALSLSVAFSMILGRAGPLECLWLVLIGTIGFELNRVVISNVGIDIFGTFYIFAFGGALGLVVAIILRGCKEQKGTDRTAAQHYLYTADSFSASYALIGSLLIFVLFPLMAYDIDSDLDWNVNFTPYAAPLCVILAMSASTVTAFIFSTFFNQQLNVRDLVYAPVAGGIAVGAASCYITNPTYAILVGVTAGFAQTLIHKCFERPSAQNKVIATISWSLPIVQALIGACYAAGWRAIMDGNTNGINATTDFSGMLLKNHPIFEFLICLISIGIGAVFGLLVAIPVVCFNGHYRFEHFTDRTYWIWDDGISYGQIPVAAVAPPIRNEEMEFQEGESIKNQHAYL